MLDNVEVFDYLVEKGRGGVRSTISPTPMIPKPTVQDYSRGWFLRHFTRKVNDINAPIIEIDETQSAVLLDVDYYIVESTRWKISGPEHTTYRENGSVDMLGVVETNESLLEISDEKIFGIKMKLVNLKQFWRGY